MTSYFIKLTSYSDNAEESQQSLEVFLGAKVVSLMRSSCNTPILFNIALLLGYQSWGKSIKLDSKPTIFCTIPQKVPTMGKENRNSKENITDIVKKYKITVILSNIISLHCSNTVSVVRLKTTRRQNAHVLTERLSDK